MGKHDTVTKEYMSDNDIFADIFNYFLYDGEQRMKGEGLKELDSAELGIVLENDTGDAEFLSGMKRTDKLSPVVTLTLYWGAGEWNGPRSLHEMLDAEKHILNFVEDYRLNLIVPGDIKDFGKFRTELGLALEFISLSEDKSALMKLRMDERYASVSRRTVHLLNVCAGAELSLEEEGGKINMCKGLEEWAKESKLEGKVEAYFDVGMTPDSIAGKLNIPLEQVNEILRRCGMLEG